MVDQFRVVADRVTSAVGSPWALVVAFLVIVTWLVSGPVFGFSDTWQLVINTATTIVTFLMVFVIQASQNREAKATQLKLDELIRAVKGARNEIIDIEEEPDAELAQAADEFRRVALALRERRSRRARQANDHRTGQAGDGPRR